MQDSRFEKPQLDIWPLYEALPPASKADALAWQPGMPRRIFVATSVAESSIAVPGVGAVVDFGILPQAVYAPNFLNNAPRAVRFAALPATCACKELVIELQVAANWFVQDGRLRTAAARAEMCAR